MEKYLSVSEVAKALHVQPATVYKLINHSDPNRKLNPINTSSYREEGGYNFLESEVERLKPLYVKENLTPTEAAKKINRSTTYIYQLIQKGLPHERAMYRGKETYLINPEDLKPYETGRYGTDKHDLIYDKHSKAYLFQPYELNNQVYRITELKRISQNHIKAILQHGSDHLTLEDALAKGAVPLSTASNRKIITSYGYASFVFPYVTDLSSLQYEAINMLFTEAGPLNLRVKVSGSNIFVDVKKIAVQDARPEITALLSHYVAKGSVDTQNDKLLIDTGLSPITIYLKEDKKNALQELAQNSGLSLQVWLESQFDQLLNKMGI